MTEIYEEPKLFTMFKAHDLCSEGKSLNCTGCEHNQCINMPNNPVPVPGKPGYVMAIEIYKNAPEAVFLTSKEAISLMTVEEESPP